MLNLDKKLIFFLMTLSSALLKIEGMSLNAELYRIYFLHYVNDKVKVKMTFKSIKVKVKN